MTLHGVNWEISEFLSTSDWNTVVQDLLSSNTNIEELESFQHMAT